MSRVALWCVAVLLLVFHPGPHADWIKPGDQVELDADEGLVVFGVDSDHWLERIDIDWVSMWTSMDAPSKSSTCGRFFDLSGS